MLKLSDIDKFKTLHNLVKQHGKSPIPLTAQGKQKNKIISEKQCKAIRGK